MLINSQALALAETLADRAMTCQAGELTRLGALALHGSPIGQRNAAMGFNRAVRASLRHAPPGYANRFAARHILLASVLLESTYRAAATQAGDSARLSALSNESES